MPYGTLQVLLQYTLYKNTTETLHSEDKNDLIRNSIQKQNLNFTIRGMKVEINIQRPEIGQFHLSENVNSFQRMAPSALVL